MIGTTELIIIVAVILLLFGATAIPKFARSLGRAKKEFEKGLREEQIEDEADKTDTTGEKKKLGKGKKEIDVSQ